MSKKNDPFIDLFKTLSKDKNITGFSISVSSFGQKKEEVSFTKEEIDEIASRNSQSKRGVRK